MPADSNLVKQGWLTLQQGDNDRLTLQGAAGCGGGVAKSNIAAQEAQDQNTRAERALPTSGSCAFRRRCPVITQPRQYRQRPLVNSGLDLHVPLMPPQRNRTQVSIPQDRLSVSGPAPVDAVGPCPRRIQGRSLSRQEGHAN